MSTAITCPPVDDSEVGFVLEYDMDPDESGNYPFGTEATFMCITGYGIVDSSMTVCDGDGSSVIEEFNPSAPPCQRKTLKFCIQ